MTPQNRSGGGVLAIVPARAGSQGLPGKNMRLLSGRPMAAWTLEACREATLLDRIIVSTDDLAVAALAEATEFATPLVRPPGLSGPESSVIDAIAHALDAVGRTWEFVVLLQPTSPLRLGADIDAAIRLCRDRSAPAVIGVSPMLKPETFYGRVEPGGGFSANAPGAGEPVVINGAIYVGRPDFVLARRSFQGPGVLAYQMPPERGWDVDTSLDFLVCETLFPHVRGPAAAPLASIRR